MCSSDNNDVQTHTIFNCPIYDTPDKKLARINQLKGCTRCGYLNHTIDKCSFKFKGKCRNCKQYHAYFLCVKKPKTETKLEKQTKSQSSSNAVSVKVMNVNSDHSNEVIPSFTMAINNKNSDRSKIYTRVMYDPASQVSFITESALKKIEHKVIVSSCNLCINGFNNSKELLSKVVEISTVISGQVRSFQAYVVPSIKTRIHSSQFSQVKKLFKRADIKLADSRLGDKGVVDILLGVNYANILPVHSLSFGESDKLSHVYYCAAGIMVSGNVTNLITNLRYADIIKKYMSIIDNISMHE